MKQRALSTKRKNFRGCKKAVAEIRRNYSGVDGGAHEKIENAAALLLSSVNNEGESSFPFKVVHLLDELDFVLYRATFRNNAQSGLIVIDSSLPEKMHTESGRVIFVNKKDSTAHQRFTIAHEIAHYIFDFNEASHFTYKKACCTTDKESPIELRANYFAAALLMPKDVFKKEFEKEKKRQGDTYSLSEITSSLANLFDAPVTAVKLRFEETGCDTVFPDSPISSKNQVQKATLKL